MCDGGGVIVDVWFWIFIEGNEGYRDFNCGVVK